MVQQAPFPQQMSPNDLIAVYWDDLNPPKSPAGGGVFYYYDAASQPIHSRVVQSAPRLRQRPVHIPGHSSIPTAASYASTSTWSSSSSSL